MHSSFKKIKNTNSVGHDGLGSMILSVASEPIADIFKSFFELGLYRKQLKTAKVIPLHKSGEKEIPIIISQSA